MIALGASLNQVLEALSDAIDAHAPDIISIPDTDLPFGIGDGCRPFGLKERLISLHPAFNL
jgi:hypothetical protein